MVSQGRVPGVPKGAEKRQKDIVPVVGWPGTSPMTRVLVLSLAPEEGQTPQPCRMLTSPPRPRGNLLSI